MRAFLVVLFFLILMIFTNLHPARSSNAEQSTSGFNQLENASNDITVAQRYRRSYTPRYRPNRNYQRQQQFQRQQQLRQKMQQRRTQMRQRQQQRKQKLKAQRARLKQQRLKLRRQRTELLIRRKNQQQKLSNEKNIKTAGKKKNGFRAAIILANSKLITPRIKSKLQKLKKRQATLKLKRAGFDKKRKGRGDDNDPPKTPKNLLNNQFNKKSTQKELRSSNDKEVRIPRDLRKKILTLIPIQHRKYSVHVNALRNNRPSTRFVSNATVENDKTGAKLTGTVDLKPTLDRILLGIRFAHKNDGKRFKNHPLKEKSKPELPIKRDSEYYKEFVHPDRNGKLGSQRIVIGKKGEVYYTPKHYKKFIEIK